MANPANIGKNLKLNRPFVQRGPLCQAFLFGVGCCFGQGDSHVLSRLPGKHGLHAAEFNDSSDSYETTPKREWSGQLFPCNVNTATVEMLIRFYRKNAEKVSAAFRLKLEKSRHYFMVSSKFTVASTSYSLIGQGICQKTSGTRFLGGKPAAGAFLTGNERQVLFWRETRG